MKIEPNTPRVKPAGRIKGYEVKTVPSGMETGEHAGKTKAVQDVAFSISAYTIHKGNQAEITIRDAQEGLLLLRTAQDQLRIMLSLLQQARDAALQNKPIHPFLTELQRLAKAAHYKEIPLLDGSYTAVWIEVSAKRQLEFQTRLLNVAVIGAGIREDLASIHASTAVMAAYMTDISSIIERLAVYADIQKKNVLLTGSAEISAEQWDALRLGIIASQISTFYSERILPRLRDEKISLLLITAVFIFLFAIIYFSIS